MCIYTINLGDTLQRTARKYPHKIALVSHEGVKLTYQEFNQMANRFGNGLKALGANKGTHVVTFFNNANEQLIAFFGVLKIGGVVLPINVRLQTREIIEICNHSRSSILVYGSELDEQVGPLRGELETVQTYIRVGDEEGGPWMEFEQVLDRGNKEDPDIEVTGDDPAFLVYTAGTTGEPKGVVMSHNGLMWNCVNWVHAGVYREDDLSLQVFPLYHVAALCSVLTYIYLGGTIYLKKFFDPKDCMETIMREKITRWAAAPTVFSMILELPDINRYDTRSLTMLGSGAAIMPSGIRSRLRQVFPNAGIFDTYGMTEASGGITTLLPEDSKRKSGSVGKPHITVEVRVVDPDDRDVAPDEVGEIIFRANNLMKGYYLDPERTREVMRNGWMHTGDMGRFDEEGFLYIVDRKRDMIITGGENVYPREVEDVLYGHPDITEAAVIGVDDPKWGEAIKAVLVSRKGSSVSESDILSHCREKIAGYKIPKSIDFVESLPKNAAGKVLRKELRAQYKKTAATME